VVPKKKEKTDHLSPKREKKKKLIGPKRTVIKGPRKPLISADGTAGLPVSVGGKGDGSKKRVPKTLRETDLEVALQPLMPDLSIG